MSTRSRNTFMKDLPPDLPENYKFSDGSPDIFGAGGGTRTHTRGEPNWILNPARLPISPLRLSGCLFLVAHGSVMSPQIERPRVASFVFVPIEHVWFPVTHAEGMRYDPRSWSELTRKKRSQL